MKLTAQDLWFGEPLQVVVIEREWPVFPAPTVPYMRPVKDRRPPLKWRKVIDA
jgi:hypothetical protein